MANNFSYDSTIIIRLIVFYGSKILKLTIFTQNTKLSENEPSVLSVGEVSLLLHTIRRFACDPVQSSVYPDSRLLPPENKRMKGNLNYKSNYCYKEIRKTAVHYHFIRDVYCSTRVVLCLSILPFLHCSTFVQH